MSEERFSLKDHLFNAEKISYLTGLLDPAIPGFDRLNFETEVMSRLPDLELKERIAWIAEVLSECLDPDFAVAADQIRASLPPPLDPSLRDGDFGDFVFAPFGKFVEDHGLDHYDTSITLLKELTTRFSMEGSIRPFIAHRPEETLALFAGWARDPHYHVRRLVSESTRPLLPWAPRIEIDIRAPLPLLDVLHADPTRFVTRSVANHLNDIAKIEPALVVTTLGRWHESSSQDPAELDWITRHALRTLVKRGDPGALTLLGYSPEPHVDVAEIAVLTPEVLAGDGLRFSFSVTARRSEKLVVDYVIEFARKNGRRSPKVFKLKRLDLGPGEKVTLEKRHPLRRDATTYRLHPGAHGLFIVVNGRPMGRAEFEVVV